MRQVAASGRENHLSEIGSSQHHGADSRRRKKECPTEIAMHYDGNQSASTGTGQSSRLLKTISIIALCLILCLSTSSIVSAHTSNTRDTVTRTLSGTATGWSSSSLFPGPVSSAVTISMKIDN